MSEYMRSRNRDEGDGFFCRFTFGQFFALLVIEVFTLFFVFYLGAKYGQEFLGIEKQVSDVAATEDSQTQPASPEVLTTSDPAGAKATEEMLDKAKTPELKERIRQMLANANQTESRPNVIDRNLAQENPAAETVAPQASAEGAVAIVGGQETNLPANETAMPVTQAAAQNVPANDPTKMTGEEKGTPAKLQASDAQDASAGSVIRVKSADNARYSVQVGSYPTMQEATKKVEEWKSKGYPAYMMVADIPERGRWFRVRMGGFENRNDAERYLRDVKSRDPVDALVVLNEQ